MRVEKADLAQQIYYGSVVAVYLTREEAEDLIQDLSILADLREEERIPALASRLDDLLLELGGK